MMRAAAAGSAGASAAVGWTAFGAPVQLVVTRALRLERGRAGLAAELIAMDGVCGSRPGSELAGLAGPGGPGEGGRPVRISPLLAEAIAAALDTARLTGGDVDPTAREGLGIGWSGPAGWEQVRLDVASGLLWLPPGLRLDLSATVTAWAADRCAAWLAGELGCGVLVGLGANIAVAGTAPAGGWRIRLQDGAGQAGGTPPTVVAIHDGGLATSGTAVRRLRRDSDALRYILDPRSGAIAAPFWRMVSVAAACCASASAASTAAMIRGRRAERWLSSLPLPARLVALDGRVHTVAGWPART